MENTKYGKRREGRWTPIRAKVQDNRANPNSWETHVVRKRWDIGLLRALILRIMMMMITSLLALSTAVHKKELRSTWQSCLPRSALFIVHRGKLRSTWQVHPGSSRLDTRSSCSGGHAGLLIADCLRWRPFSQVVTYYTNTQSLKQPIGKNAQITTRSPGRAEGLVKYPRDKGKIFA